MTGERAEPLGPTTAADAQPTELRGRRQWPLPKQAVPGAPLLEVENLRTYFRLSSGVVHAVDGVTFTLDYGEALGIAGESGCGKTTTALSLVRLLPVERQDRGRRDQAVRDRPRAEDRAPAAALPLARDQHRLPGRDERAQPGPAGPRPDRRADRAAACRMSRAESLRRAGELLELVGIPKKRGARLSPRAVRRDAPAGDDRDGARLRSGDHHRRRADDRPRRHGPGPDPGAPRAPPRRAQPVADPDHPRPVGHRRDVRPGADHVRRPGGRGGQRPRGLRAGRDTRTPRSCCPPSRTSRPTGGRSTSSRARRPTCARRRRAAGSIRAAPSRCRSARRSCRPRSRSPMASGWPATCTRRARDGVPVTVPPPNAVGPTGPLVGIAGRHADRTARGGRLMADDLLRLEGLKVHFPIRGGIVDTIRAPAGRRRPGGRRDRPHDPPRRGPRSGRRVGQRQDHDRPGGRQADPPDGRAGHLRRPGRQRPVGRRRAARLPAAGPDHLPGPVRDAQPEADDPRLRGRADRGQPPRLVGGRSRGAGGPARSRRPGCGRRATSRSATRTSCPAASGSGSSSPAPWSWTRS